MPRLTLDCSLMFPPEPMVAVLEQLGGMAEGDQLLMVHRQRPVGLLPELIDRGYEFHFEAENEGRVELLIWKARCTKA